MKKSSTLLTLLLASCFAFCQWSTNPVINNAICTDYYNQNQIQMVSDGSGGAIITWVDYRYQPNYTIFCQRINSNGSVQWTTNGIQVSSSSVNNAKPAIIADGSGGAIISWIIDGSFGKLYAQRINASGAIQWISGGILICSGTATNQWTHEMVSDGNGGCIVAWNDSRNNVGVNDDDVYAQHINAAGSNLWAANGIAIASTSGYQGSLKIASDGSGGAVIIWEDQRAATVEIYTQKVNGAGAMQWAANGVLVNSTPQGSLYPQLISDAGGAIICWVDRRNAGTAWDIYAQKLNANGALQWAANGLPICLATGNQTLPQLTTDGAGGAIITWDESQSASIPNPNIYAQKVNTSGAVVWAANGVGVCLAASAQHSPQLVSDGINGAIITWQDPRTSNIQDIYAQRINSNGSSLWTNDGVAVSTATFTQYSPIIINTGNGIIISWTDYRNDLSGSRNDIYAQRLNINGTLGSIANSGMLDPTFGTGGIVTTPIGSVSSIKATTVQTDGKVVVAGLSHTASNQDFGVARYNTNGTLDNTFNGTGEVITSIGAGNAPDIALSIAIQGDGKIVVAGYTFNGGNSDFSMVRYNTDGSLDNGFDGDGKLITSFGVSKNSEIFGIAIQPDGKIVAVGRAYSGTTYDFALARYNTDGTPDNSFDNDGKVITPISVGDDEAHSIIIQSDGKIVLGGTSSFANIFALARYNTNGSLDNSFDVDGIVTTSISSGDVINSIALQGDGKIVVAGKTHTGSNNDDFALARYNTNGSLDNSFDGDGKVIFAISSFNDVAYAVAMQADGKILLAGSSGSFPNDFAVTRFNVNGSPDNTFDGDAKVITNINADDMAFAMKLSGLRIYVAGQSNNDMFTIVAYLNDATQIVLPLHFTNTKAFIKNSAVQVEWTAENELNVKEYAIERSANGRQFTKIATLNANTNGNKNYSSLDATPFTGNNYYRIKAIDNDGKFMYSAVLLVKITGDKNITVYPNPVKRGGSLQISLQNITAHKIEIINTAGQVVYSNSAKQTGSISLALPGAIPAGQYVLRIITAIEVRLQKIQIN
jgi:uncharacterized delta-60 repeat protein